MAILYLPFAHPPTMQVFARLRVPEGPSINAGPGAIIGRAFTADVRLDDSRVSEAHALVSLRGGELVLFALRGRLRIDGRDVSRVELVEGLCVEFAPELVVVVEAVELPATLLALEGPGVPRQTLVGTTSVMATPTVHLANGEAEGAAAVIWSDSMRWRLRRGRSPVRTLRSGDEFEVGGLSLRAVEVPRVREGVAETSPRASAERLTIVSSLEIVQIWRAAELGPCVLKGYQARLFNELLSVGGPFRWDLLVKRLWPGPDEPESLRHRLDVTLARLRQRLDSAQIRRDLVTAHRNGHLEVLLYPGDQAQERA